MIPCKSCGKEIANNAETCPHCGFRIMDNGDRVVSIVSFLFFLPVIVFIIWAVVSCGDGIMGR